MITVKKCCSDVKTILIYFMIFVSSMMLLRYDMFTLFFFLQICFILYMFCLTKKIVFVNSFIINILFIELIISNFLSIFFGNLPLSYKKGALATCILIFPIYFVVSYLKILFARKKQILVLIRSGIRCFCVVQIFWALIQYIGFRFFDIDINQVIFSDILNLVDIASSAGINGKKVPSGLCWHPSLLAPMVVLTYCFFDNKIIKGLAFVCAILSNNSTALIGAAMCVLWDVFLYLIQCFKTHEKGIPKKHFIMIIGLIVLVVGVFAFTDIGNRLIEKFIYILHRITGQVNDGGSANAHIRYYTALPQVVAVSSLPQILFGYGLGCSGYLYTMLFNQYVGLKSWTVESDIVDILISRGVFGFTIFYSLILMAAFKGYKINKKYFILFITIALEGITYNVQFEWVFLLELILFMAIEMKYDIFEGKSLDQELPSFRKKFVY